MKKLLTLALVAAAVLLVYNFATRGKFTLAPSQALSADDRTLEDLEARLDGAARTYDQAGRSAGLSGMDTTSDAGAALGEVGAIEKDLRELKKTASSDASKRKIDDLLKEARILKGQMGA